MAMAEADTQDMSDNLSRPALNSPNTARLSILCLALGFTSAHAIEYETTEDYIAISIETEEFDTKDDRWVLTNASTGQLAPELDPDPNHSDTASGGVYFELLPDTRVTHEDPIVGGFWGPPGVGPQMTWSINVPEPGRYYIHARAYSTGTEDNGIHIGFNGGWPISGRTLQICSAGKRAWAWSSNKRDSGGASCGISHTSFLDFENAGPHTINVSAREDGFELDKLTLIKDLSGNTRICSPTTATAINCRNGSIEGIDEQTDIAVTLSATPETVADGSEELSVGSTFTVSALLENHDNFDNATDIVVMAEFAEGLDVTSMPESCVQSGQVVTCNVDSLEPTGHEDNNEFSFDVAVLAAGAEIRTIDVDVQNALIDSNFNNNTDSISVQVADSDLSTDVSLELSLERDGGEDGLAWTVGDLGSVNLLIENESANESGTVVIAMSVPPGVDIDLLPAECSGTSSIVCSLNNLGAGESRELQIDISASNDGAQVFSAYASVANDGNAANDEDTDIAVFNNAPVIILEPETTIDEPADEATDETNDALTNLLSSGQNDVSAELPADELANSEELSAIDVANPTRSGGSGAVSWKALIALLMLVSASVYGRHKRQAVAIRK